MKKRISVLLLILCLLPCVASAEIQRNDYLDVALSGLEQGNPFIARYNELTGADVQPMFETGIPYFFAGRDATTLLWVRKVTQVSKYGGVGTKCLYGFDCVGYSRWIQDQLGYKNHPSLTDMIIKRAIGKNYRMEDLVWDKGAYTPSYFKGEKLDIAQITSRLQIGDFLVAKHGGRHILMYIGTARDYGYTEEEAPEMEGLLDYPLFISCVNDPNYVDRTQKYIDENGLDAKPSKGGVTVSIVGVAESDAPHMRLGGAKEFYYYDLGDYQLSVYDLTSATSYVFWRTPETDKIAKK